MAIKEKQHVKAVRLAAVGAGAAAVTGKSVLKVQQLEQVLVH
jgi:hypothetical protein